MRIWTISDTHCKHGFLEIPKNIDLVIHAGDESNYRDPYMNNNECLNFLEWYKNLNIQYKVFVPGNHSTAIGRGLIKKADIPKEIIFLLHESVEIDGIKIFGSPYTPSFGTGWAFNVHRNTIGSYWEEIPANTDILVTHGPPRGILDLTLYDSRDGADGKSFFQCGCDSLLEKIKEIKPKFNIFGHIHNEPRCYNSGMLKPQNLETTFINASVVDLSHNINNNGQVFEI